MADNGKAGSDSGGELERYAGDGPGLVHDPEDPVVQRLREAFAAFDTGEAMLDGEGSQPGQDGGTGG